LVGDLTLAVDALGVDAKEDVDAVAGPLGDLGSVHASVEPERYRRMPEVVRPAASGEATWSGVNA
jgi:hypothetical protein